MANIKVGRYEYPQSHGYAGWIEPKDRSWILFVKIDGTVEAFLTRTKTGAVV